MTIHWSQFLQFLLRNENLIIGFQCPNAKMLNFVIITKSVKELFMTVFVDPHFFC